MACGDGGLLLVAHAVEFGAVNGFSQKAENKSFTLLQVHDL